MTQQVSFPFASLQMPLSQILFSIKGRIPRSTWWVTFTINLLVSFLVLSVLINASEVGKGPHPIIGALTFGVFIWCIVVNVSIGAKRWHDMDRSAWLCLFPIIPYVGALAIIWYGFVRGTKGPNRYGADPLATSPSLASTQQSTPSDVPASQGRG
jgi:uncharacterized membrane protein YhaH (DUF805 family)